MKALSVKQPWAILLVEGKKTIEVRSTPTKHRGPLLICASKAPANVFWHDTVEDKYRLLHAGCLIGIVDLVDCRPMVKADDQASYGNYTKGAYAWVCKPVHYVRPDKMIGRLGVFDYEAPLVRIANDATDWLFNYPTPQGEMKFDPETCDFV